MSWLAAIEIDRRQQVITSTDKLKELLGGSWTIADTTNLVREIITDAKKTWVILPVSGSIWLQSTDLADLRAKLWAARQKIVKTLNLPCTFVIVPIENNANPDIARKALESRILLKKAAKSGGDGTPSLPLLASCQIQTSLPATIWTPSRSEDDQHRRRNLTHSSSAQRLDRGFDTMKNFLHRFPESVALNTKTEWPLQFSDLASFPNDQYIALLKADADGMSQLSGSVPLADLKAFSGELEKTIWEALRISVTQSLPATRDWKIFPIVPIVRAGEDTSILCRRDLALNLARRFADNYAKLARANDTLRKAADHAHTPLTLSMGILFVRQGFPFEIMWDLAEDLQDSAKKARKGCTDENEKKTGWLDFLWLQSSGREELDSLREHYTDEGLTFHLSSRPWPFSKACEMIQLARNLSIGEAAIPPRKWVELGQILRLGHEFSDLAWKRWLAHLSEQQRNTLIAGLPGLPGLSKSPWRTDGLTRTTPLLDLVEIIRTMEKE